MTTKSDKAFRTISEVAEELGVQPHVLRFWETKFRQVSPMKRGGGRRFYRPEDVELLRRVKSLLHTEGYTIKGVQRMLSQGGAKNLPEVDEMPKLLEGPKFNLAALLGELEDIRELLKKSSV